MIVYLKKWNPLHFWAVTRENVAMISYKFVYVYLDEVKVKKRFFMIL